MCPTDQQNAITVQVSSPLPNTVCFVGRSKMWMTGEHASGWSELTHSYMYLLFMNVLSMAQTVGSCNKTIYMYKLKNFYSKSFNQPFSSNWCVQPSPTICVSPPQHNSIRQWATTLQAILVWHSLLLLFLFHSAVFKTLAIITLKYAALMAPLICCLHCQITLVIWPITLGTNRLVQVLLYRLSHTFQIV